MKKAETGFNFIKGKGPIRLEGIKDIAILGDIGCTSFSKESKAALARILKIDADLFIILGDLVFMGQEDEFREVIDFCKERAGKPVYALCGNHDRLNYSKFLGSSDYFVIMEKYVLVFLDNNRMRFEDAALELLRSTLVKHGDKKFIVAFHIPPPTDLAKRTMDYQEWNKLKSILDPHKERIICLFSGHIHAYIEYRLDGYRCIITGGGGAVLDDVEQDTVRSHHAVKVSFKDSGEIDTSVIPV